MPAAVNMEGKMMEKTIYAISRKESMPAAVNMEGKLMEKTIYAISRKAVATLGPQYLWRCG